MKLRRTLGAFALVLFLAAVVTVLTQPQSQPAAPPPPPVASPPTAVMDPVTVGFGPTGSAQTAQTVPTNAHVVVSVAVTQPAQVSLPGLGQNATAQPGTPASFDLFTDTALATPVVVSAPQGPATTIGTLVIAQSP